MKNFNINMIGFIILTGYISKNIYEKYYKKKITNDNKEIEKDNITCDLGSKNENLNENGDQEIILYEDIYKESSEERINCLNINVFPNLEFIQGFINFLYLLTIKNDNYLTKYSVSNEKIYFINNSTNDEIIEKLTNIYITKLDMDFNINITNDIIIKYKKLINKKKIINCLSETINFKITSSMSIDDINIEFNEFINYIKSISYLDNTIETNINIFKLKFNGEIKTELINKTYRDFDTIYLRKTDEEILKNVLTKFHTKKELLKSLGLMNKLCILLNGNPGTGKSSTIQAIASYLKKDIYYLSFDTIKSNEELYTIFNTVVKNNGIIVTENIDTITNLLFKKDDDYVNFNVKPEITKEFTMEFLFNLLQGTITPDGLIFIATTNNIDKLEPAFYRNGRFDIRITLKECDNYQLNKIYKKIIGREIPYNLLIKIPENKITPAEFIFTIKDYINDIYTDEQILKSFI
jgi:ATP-dependent 26S proteasome regulatory subunit